MSDVQFPSLSPWVSAVLWYGLAERPAPPTLLGDVDVETIVGQRLAPLALDYLRVTAAEASDESVRMLRGVDFTWTSFSIEVDRSSRAATGLLDRAGIGYVLFKGPAIRQSYRSPRHRLFSDVDLLVRPSDFKRARRLLFAQGWAESVGTMLPYDGMNAACREAQNLKREPGESIDLHHQLPPWLWTRRVHFDDVYADSVVVDGRHAMTPEWNLLVASLHMVSDKSKPGQTLIIWRDLAELAAIVDVDKTVTLARRLHLATWLRMVLELLPSDVRPYDLVERLPHGPPPHRSRLALLTSARLVGRRIPFVQLFRLPTPRALLYALGVLLPPPQFIRRRYPTLLGGYREWWTGVADARPSRSGLRHSDAGTVSRDVARQ